MENAPTTPEERRGRIIGIGGVFFKSSNPESLRSWYHDRLGIVKSEHGTVFPWRSTTGDSREHVTAWCVFDRQSKYFDPSPAPMMINYIVEDLDALLERLSAEGVSIDPKRESHDYGRFAWIYDPDGNKIELWEP